MKKLVFPLSTISMLLFVSAVSVGTSSCEKDPITVHDTTEVNVRDTVYVHDTLECESPTYPVTGLWEGTYQTDQVSHAPTYASMTIFPDGTIMRRNKVVGTANEYSLTRGKWTLSGSTFQYRDTTLLYSGGTVVETGTLTFKNDGTLSNGNWENISGQTYTGTYPSMKRIN